MRVLSASASPSLVYSAVARFASPTFALIVCGVTLRMGAPKTTAAATLSVLLSPLISTVVAQLWVATVLMLTLETPVLSLTTVAVTHDSSFDVAVMLAAECKTVTGSSCPLLSCTLVGLTTRLSLPEGFSELDPLSSEQPARPIIEAVAQSANTKLLRFTILYLLMMSHRKTCKKKRRVL